jgi:hypothetical protein
MSSRLFIAQFERMVKASATALRLPTHDVTPCQGFRSVLPAESMDRWSTVVSLSIVRAQKVEQADTLESLAYPFGCVCDPQRRIHGAGGGVCAGQNANARGVDK